MVKKFVKYFCEISQDDKNADIIGFKKKSTELYWILRTRNAARNANGENAH